MFSLCHYGVFCGDRCQKTFKFNPFQIEAETQQHVTKVEGCEYFLKAL